MRHMNSPIGINYPRVPLKSMDPSMLVLELSTEAQRLMGNRDAEMVISAMTVASFLHRDQRRMVRGDMPKVPYIEHPLRVALRLIRWGIHNPLIIAAALLHDTVEDCAEELISVFGDGLARGASTRGAALSILKTRYHYNTPDAQVAELVAAVTNPEVDTSVELTREQRDELYLEHIRRIANCDEWTVGALLIKMSDLKDNAGSIRYQLDAAQKLGDRRMIESLLRRADKYREPLAVIQQGAQDFYDQSPKKDFDPEIFRDYITGAFTPELCELTALKTGIDELQQVIDQLPTA